MRNREIVRARRNGGGTVAERGPEEMGDPGREALALLRWYHASGVETLTGESAANFYAWDRRRPGGGGRVAERVQVKAPALPLTAEGGDQPDAARGAAEQIAGQAKTLEELRRALESFEDCALKQTARNLVFADGDPASKVMLIGEAPGAEEDRRGVPFVGRSGQLLDRMLAAIGLDRRQVYITNVLPWRPPANRTPSDLERAQCRPFLDRHISLQSPALLVLLGGVAAKEILESAQGIMKLRGRWTEARIGEAVYPALPTLHPAYLLRQPGQKALAWRDLQLLRARLDEIGGG